MSRKAFLLLIVRIDSTSFIRGDCLKSQIFFSENRKSASGTEYFSLARTFRTVWGALELAYRRCSGMILDNSTYHCGALELAL